MFSFPLILRFDKRFEKVEKQRSIDWCLNKKKLVANSDHVANYYTARLRGNPYITPTSTRY